MSRARVGFAAWLLMAGALYFFENNAGTRALLAASALLPALSIACAALAARRVRCALEMPDLIPKGETARGRCRLTGSRLLFGCRLVGDLAVENPLTGERRAEPLKAAGVEASFELAAAHCGQLRVSAACAALGDLFGLARFPVAPAEAAALTSAMYLPRRLWAAPLLLWKRET